MHRVQKCGSLLAALFVVLVVPQPGQAQSPTQSDTGGTNVFNSPTVDYGFEPLSRSTLVAPVLQQLQASLASLLANGNLSPATQSALTALSNRLTAMAENRWNHQPALDRDISRTAAGLLQDLNRAVTACNTGDRSACEVLNTLLGQINPFLSQVDDLRSALIRYAQTSRTY